MTAPKTTSTMLRDLLRVLLFYILTVIIFATTSGLTKGLPYADYISLSVSSILTFFLIVLFIKSERLALTDVGISFRSDSASKFLSGFGVGIIMVAIQASVATSFAEVSFVLSSNISILNIIGSLALYLLVALREELVFRSYSIRSLAKAINPLTALVIITILFILEHVIAGVSWKMSVIGSGLGGILFGLAALKSQGIALPLGIHSSWNFTQWMLGFKNDTGIWREVVKPGEESSAENVALLGFSIAMCLAIFGIAMLYRQR